MNRRAHRFAAAAMATALVLGGAACGDDDGDAEVEDVEDGAEDLGNEIEEGADEVEDEVEN